MELLIFRRIAMAMTRQFDISHHFQIMTHFLKAEIEGAGLSRERGFVFKPICG